MNTGPSQRRTGPDFVREARQRLTSSSGMRADFDFELMQDYAASRVGAALPMAAIVGILAIVASFWVPIAFTAVWAALVIASLLIVVQMARRFTLADPTKFNAERWTTSFIAAETVSGLALSLLALFALVAGPDDLTPVMFAMALVGIASNAIATHTLPPATLVSTLPVTMTVSAALIAVGGTLNYTLAAVTICGEIFFLFLARQLHASELETITHQSEKDTLIYELEEARTMSDEARRHAEQANIAKSQFLATMSHELRTPLTSVIGNAELMELVPQSEVDRRRSLHAIRDAGRHLLALVSDLLDISRIEVGRYELLETPVSLNALVGTCIGMLELRAAAKRIDVSFVADPLLPLVRGDERALRQMVLNLLGNALKFSHEGGTVSVSVTTDEKGDLSISIEDNGPGIPAHEIEFVMSSFGQGALARANPEQGTGLGLPIARRFAELHQGTLTLTSRLRVGTKVVARLPRQRLLHGLKQSMEPDSSVIEAKDITTGTGDRNLGGLDVLVVEDDEAILHVIESIVRSGGHTVTVATNGELALEILLARQFHCVLLDMHLPGRRGTEVKAEYDNKTLGKSSPRFFAVTADASRGQRDIYASLGIDGVIEKPFESDDILKAISTSAISALASPKPIEYPPAFEVGHIEKLRRALSLVDFINSLEQAGISLSTRADALNKAIENVDVGAVRLCCHTIAGTAAQYGLTALSENARAALRNLDVKTPVENLSKLAGLVAEIRAGIAALQQLRATLFHDLG